jgi:hypothetical protein
VSVEIIRVKRPRVRKPTAPRTCCLAHTDQCRFGRDHVWAGPFLLDGGKPVDGRLWSMEGDVKCANCGDICTAEREGDGQ